MCLRGLPRVFVRPALAVPGCLSLCLPVMMDDWMMVSAVGTGSQSVAQAGRAAWQQGTHQLHSLASRRRFRFDNTKLNR